MHYQQALDAFNAMRSPTLDRWTIGLMYGDVNKSRVLFIRERMLELDLERFPDHEYLDEFGRKRPMPDPTGAQRRPSAAADAPDDATGVGFEQRPGWLAVSEEAAEEAEEAVGRGGAGREQAWERQDRAAVTERPRDARAAGELDDDEETARKEWLEYHIQVGEWQQAEELVVTARERDELGRRRAARDRSVA